MMRQRAFGKIKAILLVDIIIFSVATGTYLYLQASGQLETPLNPAEFYFNNLLINPVEADVGEPISISTNVTNIGDLASNHTLSLIINDVIVENQTIRLAGRVSSIVEFIHSELSEGNFTVQIGNLTDRFNVKAFFPEITNIKLSSLVINPYEINLGESTNLKLNAKNIGSTNESLPVRLFIDGILSDTNLVQLDPGDSTQVEFILNATELGIHRVKVNNVYGGFNVVPVGMHTLTILTYPTPDEGQTDLTINGEELKTPYSEILPEGKYTISVPATDPTGEHAFLYWQDGPSNPTRVVTLSQRITITAEYERGVSCPSLSVWNGTEFIYLSDVSNHGWLGYINYITDDPVWPIVYWRNNPWDYIPIQSNLMQTRNGYYEMLLTQKWNEIFYLDSAYMVVVDHPSDVDVYSTMVEQYLDLDYMGKIYTVSNNPLKPIYAVNEKDENMLPYISEIDDVFTTGFNGLKSDSWDDISWNALILDLGDLSKSEEIKLVIRAIVDWGSGEDYSLWIEKFFAQPVPNGTQITPAPYLEVKDSDGNWIRVPDSRQFPLPPDAVPRTFVVDLTGLFPCNDYSIRINNFWNVTFDYIGVDVSPQKEISINTFYPYANLRQVFETRSNSLGNFTRYGDVTDLLLAEDDKFVIGRQGDEVSLLFPISGLAPPAHGMVRDYFVFIALWFKDETGNWGYGFDFTVDPLPFMEMSGFPYPLDIESYPYDEDHIQYLQEYNTREIRK
jgi:hypothetical protein